MRSLLSAPTVTYCEQAGKGLIKRPWAALSNLAFFVAGIAILLHGRGSKLSRLFGVTALIIGTFSTMYDITYIYGSQLLDLSAMLFFVSLLLYLNLSALGFTRKTIIAFLTLIFVMNLCAIICFAGHSGDVIFGLYVGGVIASEIVLVRKGIHRHGRQWALALVLFALGFLLWITDNRKFICFDIGLFNGRAIFHYIAATTVYLLYRFYDKQAEVTYS